MNIFKKARKLASMIERYYRCHGINVSLRPYGFLKDCQRFIFHVIPSAGTVKKGIFDHANDIKAAMQIPFFQPFEIGVHIFLAVSQEAVQESSLWKMLTSQAFRNNNATLPIALGYDLMGRMVFDDLEKMPHAMYAGATRSGKSIGLICLILSLICGHPANEVNLIVFDIGADTLDVLENVPHLSHPIIKDKDMGIHVIRSLAEEMERRLNLDSSHRCDLPAIVCVIDEYTSFVDSIKDKQQRQQMVDHLSNLLRRGRRAKIHLVLATQNPTNKPMAAEVDNITSRMAFKVARFQTSVAIINCGGAEKLPGNGAMLYLSRESSEPIYVQGAYMSISDVEQLVAHIQSIDQDFSNKFVIPEVAVPDSPAPLNAPVNAVRTDNEEDQEFTSIILWTLEREEISASQIKQDFRMGNRANEIMDKLFDVGLIREKFANQPRKVIPQSVGDVPKMVVDFLARRGVSIDDVAAALSKRNPDNAADYGEEHGHDNNC